MVMLKSHDPSLGTVSLALQVTVVKPTGNPSPDVTMLPRWSQHMILVKSMGPSTVSLAEGKGNQITLATAIEGSTFLMRTLLGQ